MNTNNKLQELRREWLKANLQDRKIIEARAKLLQWAEEKRSEKFVRDVEKALT